MNCEPVFDNPDLAQVWRSSVVVDDRSGLTGAALVDQLAVLDHGVPMVGVVHIDAPSLVEDLGRTVSARPRQ